VILFLLSHSQKEAPSLLEGFPPLPDLNGAFSAGSRQEYSPLPSGGPSFGLHELRGFQICLDSHPRSR